MSKQIKLIRLVSLTLPLSLVLINPLASQANEHALSDKTEWLTSSQNSGASKQPVLQALSAQEDNYPSGGKSIVVRSVDNPQQVVKLRPFNAHRRLPSRHDLELTLQAQEARMAATEKPVLNGQVAAFTSMPDASPPSNAVSFPFQSVPKSRTYWQTPTINHSANNLSRSITRNPAPAVGAVKISASTLSQAEKYFQQTDPANLTATPSMASAPNETVNPQQGFSFLHLAEHHLISQPMAPAADSFNVETNPSMSFPMSSEPSMPSSADASGFGSAGPPPFPLNLLPAPALKQLIRSVALGVAPHNSHSPRSYFGSWHNGMSLSPSYISNLPPSSFHTFIQPTYSRRTRSMHGSNHWALSVVTASRNQSISQNHISSSNKQRSLLKSQSRVATYPAYAKQSLKSFNFMQ